MQSIFWFAWPPPGRSSTLKIACGSNIYDIRGNTTFVANYLQELRHNPSMVCLASTGKEFDAENSLRVKY